MCCAYVGCGRYNLRHAVEHNDMTSHNFSVELNSHRIWNYYGDNYVHRIIQTKLGGNEANTKYEEMEAEVIEKAGVQSANKKLDFKLISSASATLDDNISSDPAQSQGLQILSL